MKTLYVIFVMVLQSLTSKAPAALPGQIDRAPARLKQSVDFTLAALWSDSPNSSVATIDEDNLVEDPIARIGGWIENNWLILLVAYAIAFASSKALCHYTSIIPIWGKVDLACLAAPWVLWIPWTIWVIATKRPESEVIRISAFVILPPLLVSIILSFAANGFRLHYAILSLVIKVMLFPLIPFVATLALRGLTLGTEDSRYKDGTKNNLTSSVMQGLNPVFDFLLGDFVRSRTETPI